MAYEMLDCGWTDWSDDEDAAPSIDGYEVEELGECAAMAWAAGGMDEDGE